MVFHQRAQQRIFRCRCSRFQDLEDQIKPIEVLSNKHIPSVTLIGSMILGLLAGVSDVLGVFGSGIGILLMVDILINYYNQLVKEQVEIQMPRLGALLGRK